MKKLSKKQACIVKAGWICIGWGFICWG